MRRIVALLEVLHRFERHEDAADWHRQKGIRLPVNCLVSGNRPLPLDQTSGLRARDRRRFQAARGPKVAVRNWDAAYKVRAEKCGVLLVCQPLFLELQFPPLVTRDEILRIFGRIPGTQTPPRITAHEFSALSRLVQAR